MYYYIRTFGCQMNEHDSEYLAAILEEKGYQKTSELAQADVIIVNTCAVRENAVNKICGFVDSLLPYKRAKKTLRVVVTGCLVSDTALVEGLASHRRHIDLMLGTRSLDKLPHYLQRLATEKGPFCDNDLSGDVADRRTHKREDHYHAYVTITYGCDNFCSYCIVPYVRGREISRPLAEIHDEAKRLVADGVREITLLGQNVNSYGKGRPKTENFAALLTSLKDVDGLERIRFMTSHPKDFNEPIMEAIADNPKVCHQFHLPVQSGSDHLLKLMNRHYGREYYLELTETIKQRFPDGTLTTDIIVGFPGETEQDFDETLDLLKHVEFDSAYTFLYSPRQHTKAATMDGQIRDSIKKERLLRLMSLQNEISLRKNEALVGQRLTVLGEGVSHTDPTMQSGRTDGNKLIHFASEENLNGQLVDVTVTKAHTWFLLGRL